MGFKLFGTLWKTDTFLSKVQTYAGWYQTTSFGAIWLQRIGKLVSDAILKGSKTAETKNG